MVKTVQDDKVCGCGEADCRRPDVLCAKARNGQWVLYPLDSLEFRLSLRLSCLSSSIGTFWNRSLIRCKDGYPCPECGLAIEQEAEFVRHVVAEESRLIAELDDLLDVRQKEDSKLR